MKRIDNYILEKLVIDANVKCSCMDKYDEDDIVLLAFYTHKYRDIVKEDDITFNIGKIIKLDKENKKIRLAGYSELDKDFYVTDNIDKVSDNYKYLYRNNYVDEDTKEGQMETLIIPQDEVLSFLDMVEKEKRLDFGKYITKNNYDVTLIYSNKDDKVINERIDKFKRIFNEKTK